MDKMPIEGAPGGSRGLSRQQLPGAFIARFPSGKLSMSFAVLYWALLIVGLALLAVGVATASSGSTIAGSMLSVLSLFFVYAYTRFAILVPILYENVLVSPGRFRGRTTIELADVGGVGLRYTSGGRASGWVLLVWIAGTAKPVQVSPLPVTIRRAGAGVRTYIHLRGYVPNLDEVDATLLAATRPGKAAATIATQVTKVQGPTGLLAAKALQVNAPDTGGYTAYWSPDGRTGPVGLRR